VVQHGSEHVDIGRGYVADDVRIEEGSLVVADGLAANLDEKSLNRSGIELGRSLTDDLAESLADRMRLPIRAFTGHGVEGVSESDDAHGVREFIDVKLVGIAAAVSALVVVAYYFWYVRPGELHPVDDLVANDGVIGHFAELGGIQL
jgi:hypothetical protein